MRQTELGLAALRASGVSVFGAASRFFSVGAFFVACGSKRENWPEHTQTKYGTMSLRANANTLTAVNLNRDSEPW